MSTDKSTDSRVNVECLHLQPLLRLQLRLRLSLHASLRWHGALYLGIRYLGYLGSANPAESLQADAADLFDPS